MKRINPKDRILVTEIPTEWFNNLIQEDLSFEETCRHAIIKAVEEIWIFGEKD